MGRLAAWQLAMNMASARITGCGFDCWGEDMFRRFTDNPDWWDKSVAAHSIYFTIVGEHGWPGAVLFVSIFLIAWRTAGQVAVQAREIESLKWLHSLMRMLQVSLVAYGSGGAFLNLAYFDLPWHIVSLIVIGRAMLEAHVSGAADQASPEPPPAALGRRARRRGAALSPGQRIPGDQEL